MTMPDEQAEARDAVRAEQDRQLQAMDATVQNTLVISEVNRALVHVHEARALLRRTFANAVPWGVVLAVAWSVWAMVHWG